MPNRFEPQARLLPDGRTITYTVERILNASGESMGRFAKDARIDGKAVDDSEVERLLGDGY